MKTMPCLGRLMCWAWVPGAPGVNATPAAPNGGRQGGWSGGDDGVKAATPPKQVSVSNRASGNVNPNRSATTVLRGIINVSHVHGTRRKGGEGMEELDKQLQTLDVTTDGGAMATGAAVESELNHLLSGQNIQEPVIDIRLKDDNDYVPITKKTVCYIVSGIVFNENSEILMMQEAKSSCYGMWYLPAGRMEKNENITEAVQREVKEETGIEFEPSTTLAVEVATGFWYRFTLTGRATGGTLKTYEQRDKESLQAKWCSIDLIKSGRKGFPLRASDILPLIDIALHHRQLSLTAPSQIHPDILPVINPHKKLLLRTVFLQSLGEEQCQVICSTRETPHIPITVISADDLSLHIPMFRLIQEIFGSVKFHPKIHGVLQLEHCGRPSATHDGICLTLLVTMATKDGSAMPSPVNAELYDWCTLSTALQARLCDNTKSKKTIPLLLLR